MESICWAVELCCAGLMSWVCSSQGTLPHEGNGMQGLAKCRCIRRQRDGHFVLRSGNWEQNQSLLEMLCEDHTRNPQGKGEDMLIWSRAYGLSSTPLSATKSLNSFVNHTKALSTFSAQLPLPSVMMLFILISSREKKGLLEG